MELEICSSLAPHNVLKLIEFEFGFEFGFGFKFAFECVQDLETCPIIARAFEQARGGL
jgi:hypothetical protein